MSKIKKPRAIYVEDELWDKVMELAKRIGVSTSSLIRRGMKLVIEKKPRF